MQSYDDIIEERQDEIFNELKDIEEEIAHLNARLEHLNYKRTRRMQEYQMLRDVRDKGLAVSQSQRPIRVHIEDALKRIFEKAGRPLAVREILERLEEFGYERSSSYHREYQRLRAIDILEPTGARGYYQLLRHR